MGTDPKGPILSQKDTPAMPRLSTPTSDAQK